MTNPIDHDAVRRDCSVEPNRNRRQFLRNTAGASLGFAGSMFLGACGGDGSSAVAQTGDDAPAGPSDAQILNFALNLEYLEAEFYLAAIGSSLQGRGIGVDGAGTPGAVNGGRAVSFTTPSIRQYALEIAADETAHVNFLRAAIDGAGAQPVARPALDISAMGVFSAIAQAAGVIGPGEMFDPYANETNFMLAAYVFEDVGVTAYKGASPLISNKVFLEAAAGILAAEAYHAGLVRTVLYAIGLDVAGIHDITLKISDLRDLVGGVDNGVIPGSIDQGADRDQGVVAVNADGSIKIADDGTTPVGNIVPLDVNGKAFSRSASDVLNIVYATAEQVQMGGFFPQGVNGAINTSSDNAGPPPA